MNHVLSTLWPAYNQAIGKMVLDTAEPYISDITKQVCSKQNHTIMTEALMIDLQKLQRINVKPAIWKMAYNQPPQEQRTHVVQELSSHWNGMV